MPTHYQIHMGRALRLSALPFSAAMVLSGCSVSSPLSIESSASTSPATMSAVAMQMPEEDAPAVTKTFASALANALASHNFNVGEDGRLLADYAISNGTAELGVQDKAAPGSEPAWISVPRPSKTFDECDARKLRGTLMMLDSADGSVVYHGRAEMTECDFGEEEIGAVAEALAADFALHTRR